MSADEVDQPNYRDETLPVERRVGDLLGRMTLEEKVSQLQSVRANDVLDNGELDRAAAEKLLEHGTGHLTRIGGEGGLNPERAAEVVNELQSISMDTRLGIPTMPHEECLSGYMGPDGTMYPQAIGLASTWSPELVTRITSQIRSQLTAIGAGHALSPVLDIACDPRWGRTEETFGEDPYFVATMACAYVEGLQGDDPSMGVSATLKHFVAHGAGEGGKNRSSVNIGRRELREVHLFPFEAAVRCANAESVMNAYHDIDGVPCAKDEQLLTELLRGEWNFDGTVISDYYSVRFLRDEHGTARTNREAAIDALEAGIDVELPQEECYGHLVEAVADGGVAEETVDTSVRRVLRQKVRKGLFDGPTTDPTAIENAFESDGNRELARQAARESVVLLKNEGELLPLDSPDSVAVVGPKADAPEELLGDYAYAAHYPEKAAERDIITPRNALEERLGTDTVTYIEGCTTTGPSTETFDEAVTTVEDADIALAFVGARSAVAFTGVDERKRERPDVPTSGEGVDVTDLGLPGVQQELIERLQATDTPLVVVLVSGKPHAIEWIDDHVPAVVHAWLPGEEGGNGIADVLLGEHNPNGRLPLSIPRNVGQLPIYYNRKPNSYQESHVYTENTPLYPFGYGLTYTEFSYRDLDLSASEIGSAGTLTATVTVENVGDRAGDEVVQLYVHDQYPELARPVQELRGFERVRLEPGESARVRFEIGASQLAYYDRNMDLTVDPGAFEVRIGRSAEEIVASETFEITGKPKAVPITGRRYFSDVNVERGE